MRQIPHFHVFVEVFPIARAALPKLTAYRLAIGGGEGAVIRGKSAYRLQTQFRGYWVWTGQRIVTDMPQGLPAVMDVIEDLWRGQADVFGNLREVVEDPEWQTIPAAEADFVVRGLLPDVDREIRRLLAPKTHDLGRMLIELVHEVRGWVVDSGPAISISAASRRRPYQSPRPDRREL